jgi:peptide/nickel transport system permease protein
MITAVALSGSEIAREFRRSKSGLLGAAILAGLLLMTVYSVVAIPLESFRQWNNPNFWIDQPKAAAPAWTNLFGAGLPEHIIMRMDDAQVSESSEDGVRTVTHSYSVDVNFDAYPSDFMFLYSARYGETQPALQVDVERPDGRAFQVYFGSLPPAQQGQDNNFSSRVF